MKRIISFLFAFSLVVTLAAQSALHALQVVADGDCRKLPVTTLDGCIDIDFDILGHEYRRIVYKIEHMQADWSAPSDLIGSEFLAGFDGNPIEDYAESLNTTVLYTHYHLSLPNDNVSVLLSGNYRVTFTDDDTNERLGEVRFMVVEPLVGIRATMTTHTDRDINGRDQQLELEVSHSQLSIIDPCRELRTVVMQNRCWDRVVVCEDPNIISAGSVAYTHRPYLVFRAGSEYNKFEVLEKHSAGLGLDRIEYHAPYEHVVLYPVEPMHNYTYNETYNGVYVPRNSRGDAATESEYYVIHFAYAGDKRGDHFIYLVGDFTQGRMQPAYSLEWNDDLGMYEGSVMLKQGYYEYQMVWDDGSCVTGDYYETRNSYAILTYFRQRGSRYDQLCGFNVLDIKD